MAILSSHTLNSVDGSHAGGIEVELYRIEADGRREKLLEARTDEGGRFSQSLALRPGDEACQYEMVLHAGAYFAARRTTADAGQIVRDVVIRFAMPDPDARYHIPMMLAPNSYSVWWSQ